MYKTETKAFSAQKAVALIAALAIMLWSVGLSALTHNAKAANVTSVSDTLSDSDVNALSDHTIEFTIPNGMAQGDTFTIEFPGGFSIPAAMDFEDVDLTVDASEETLAAGAGAGEWGVDVDDGTNIITFTTPTNSGTGSSSAMVVQIGTNADSGVEQITNPTAGSYEILIGGTMQDSGRLRVMILDNVLVTADVSTSFTFIVAGTSTGTTINGSPTSTATTTTATELPFENLSAGTSKVLGQDLFVTTNAIGGFVVTVEQDQNLLSSTGADIDGFIDGQYDDTPTAWTSPSNDINDENTWGHWGLTSDDDDYSATQDLWVSASTTPRAIFTHDGPSDGATPDMGWTTVGYQAEITALQEAGDDYNTTLTYIATPTF